MLASTAVLNLGLYKNRFARQGMEVLHPADEYQAGIMEAIHRIKTGHYGDETIRALQDAADDLAQHGAGFLLMACTELSLIANSIRTSVPVYDSAQILAEAIVKTARNDRVRE